jgi:hypothetical protein
LKLVIEDFFRNLINMQNFVIVEKGENKAGVQGISLFTTEGKGERENYLTLHLSA